VQYKIYTFMAGGKTKFLRPPNQTNLASVGLGWSRWQRLKQRDFDHAVTPQCLTKNVFTDFGRSADAPYFPNYFRRFSAITLRFTCRWKPERGTSRGWKRSGASGC
jgi:hypothetical protein